MLPLAFQLVNRRDFQEDTVRRLEKTIDDAPPEVLIELHKKIQRGEASHKEILNVLLDSLPEHKLVGAFLPRHTYSHWLLAVGAAALFMSFFILLSRQSAQPSHLIAMGLFTATVGIGLLALLYLILHVAKLLGLSYQAALNPSIGFLVNLLAFTCLAGFCEELVKALPLLWCYRRAWARTWRGAFLWGMASGAGFGIAEAAGYATVYYNGILGPEIYAVRFLSCVALHAVWTGAVGITLHRRQARLQAAVTKSEYVWQVALIVAIPAVLHGLYDTMLTNDMIWGALGVAALSFVYLAWRIGRLNRGDRTTDTEAMIEEYWRRKTISPACETTR
jgi:RsiW-degrading membrane proteinase PrsW (M82 family)